jgi:phosphoglycerate dehydrogenase-like enzyme
MNIFQYISLDAESQGILDENLTPQVHRIIANRNSREEKQLEQFLGCEIAFGNIPADWIEKSSALKWIQLESVGYEPYLDVLPTFGKRGVLTNLHGFFGQPVAETALAGILSLKRAIDKLVFLKERKEWRDNTFRSELTILHGTNILIAGGGNIGQSFKKVISGFETAEVIVYDRNPRYADITSADEFDIRLAKADIVFSCLPDNHKTKCFFNDRRFRIMSPSAIFVNVGRGAVVEEAALVRTLIGKMIAGAVLDVTDAEPLLSGIRLWDCPNLILTQHTGGGSKSELKGKVSVFLENMELYLSGKTLKRIVNQ